MKIRVIYFEKREQDEVLKRLLNHIENYSSFTEGVFIPDMNAVVSKTKYGKSQNFVLLYGATPEVLDEFGPLIEGKVPKREGVFYEIKSDFKCEKSVVEKLIKEALIEENFRERVKTNLEILLRHSR